MGLRFVAGFIVGCSASTQLACAGAAGAPSENSSGGASSGGLTSTGGAVTCAPEAPERDAGASATWDLTLSLRVEEVPLVRGQEFVVNERHYKLTTLKFFLAEPRLLKADASTVTAQFIDSTGDPVPYNVLLIDAEQPDSLKLSLAVPPGDYTGLELGLGLSAPCNASDPTSSVYPLSVDGDMYWSWGAQYVFQRLQGQALIGEEWQNLAYHFGFDPSYQRISLARALSLGAALPATLAFDASAFLTPPEGTELALENHTVAPEWVASNLARSAFSFAEQDP